MREICPHCSYPHTSPIKQPSCLACGRLLEGEGGHPLAERPEDLAWVLARLEAHLLERAVGCLGLKGPSGAGLSTLLKRARLALLDESARLDLGASYPLPLTFPLHPFLSGASRAPSALCSLYRKILEAIFSIDLAQDSLSQERWARRVLDVWEAPAEVREAFERLWGGGGGLVEDSEGELDQSLWGELSWVTERAQLKPTPPAPPQTLSASVTLKGVTLKGLAREPLLQPSSTSSQGGASEREGLDEETRPSEETWRWGAVEVAKLILYRAQRAPIIFLCYDLQSALDTDLIALKHLISLLSATPPDGRHALCFVLERPPDLLTPHEVNQREVVALNFKEISQLLSAWHPGLDEPLATVERLLRISKGNPSALLSAIKAATRGGVFEPRALSLTADSAGGARAPLTLECALCLAAAAGPTVCLEQLRVLSRALDPTPWSNIALSERTLEALFEEAIYTKQLILAQHERFIGRESYRFARADHQERYERLWRGRYSEEERATAHRAMAEWISAQAISKIAEVQVLLSLTEHWLAVGDRGRAGEVTARAADRCARNGNAPLARAACQRALELLTPLGSWRALRALYPLSARLNAEAGAPHVAEALLQQALKRAWQLNDLAAAYSLASQLHALYEARGFAQQAAWVGEWLSRLPPGAQRDAELPEALFELSELSTLSALRGLRHRSPHTTPIAPHRLDEGHSSAARRALAMNEVRDLEPPPPPVLEVLRALKAAQFEAWVVGGSVRDRLIGRPVGDWDLTTNATPKEVARLFERVIATGIEHGTVTVLSGGMSIEVTTYRVDGAYADGRRPEAVTFTRSLREDLARRDFTINAMAWDPDAAQLEDPFGGAEDLRRGLVRAVGVPSARFQEDGLRALRAVRFAAVLAFEIDPATEEGIVRALDVFRKVSMERVQVELSKTILSDEAAWGLGALRRLQLMPDCVAELSLIDDEAWGLTLRAVERTPKQLEPRWAALFHALPSAEGVAREALERLKCARRLTQSVCHLLRWREVSPSTPRTDGQVRALAAQVQLGALSQLWGYRRAWAGAVGDEREVAAWDALAERMRALRVHESPQAPKDLALRGSDLSEALGVPPSRLIGDLLSALLQHVWEVPEDNTAEALLALAPRLLEQLRGR